MGGVGLGCHRRPRRLLAGDLAPQVAVDQVHVDPGGVVLVPGLDAVGVGVDLLLHLAAGAQAHGAGAGAAPGHLGGAEAGRRGGGGRVHGEAAEIGLLVEALVAGRPVREAPRLGLEDLELHAAEALLAGELPLHGVAQAQGHGHELADQPLARGDAVEPGLGRGDQVVLGLAVQPLGPGLARNGADLADRHLHRAGLVVRAGEAEPHGLALVHGEEDAAVVAPVVGDVVGVVVHPADREAPQPWRQRVLPAVVGDAQRALEGDAQAAFTKVECVALHGELHGGLRGRQGRHGLRLLCCRDRPPRTPRRHRVSNIRSQRFRI